MRTGHIRVTPKPAHGFVLTQLCRLTTITTWHDEWYTESHCPITTVRLDRGHKPTVQTWETLSFRKKSVVDASRWASDRAWICISIWPTHPRVLISGTRNHQRVLIYALCTACSSTLSIKYRWVKQYLSITPGNPPKIGLYYIINLWFMNYLRSYTIVWWLLSIGTI